MVSTKEHIGRKIRSDVASRQPAMTKNLIVRVSDEMHEKLAQIAREMTAEMPGHRVTISDVARGIIEFGIKDRAPTYRRSRDEIEQEGKKEGI
jgi:hypothetical protein